MNRAQLFVRNLQPGTSGFLYLRSHARADMRIRATDVG